MGQGLRLQLPIQGVPVPSLVGKLRSYMSPSQKTKTQNRSNLIANSVKTSKLVHIKLSLKTKFFLVTWGNYEEKGVWDRHVHTAIFKMENQQGPTL